VKARYQDFIASLEGQFVARGAMLPQVNLSGWASHEARSHMNSLPGYEYDSSGYALELRQLLFDGKSTYNVWRQAGFDKLSRYYEVMATSDSTALGAAQAYLDVARYRELQELARANYTLHSDTYKLIQQRSQSGVGRGADLEQAGSRLALSQTNLMTETSNLNDVTARFVRIVTAPPVANLGDVPDVNGRLPLKPDTFIDSLRANPSILAKQASVLASERGLAAAEGTYAPVVEVVASRGRSLADPVQQPLLGRMQSTSVGVQARWNLFRGGSDRARIRQNVAQHVAAEDLRDYACRNVQQDLSTAWNNMANLRAQLPFLREHAESSVKVRNAYRDQFRIGQRTLLDLLNTENESFQAARALANAQYDLKLTGYRWLSLSHQLLPVLGLRSPGIKEGDVDSDDPLAEDKELALTDEMLKSCAGPVPDVSQLVPVARQ
jgi:adhesin transport system outer membrane protein